MRYTNIRVSYQRKNKKMDKSCAYLSTQGFQTYDIRRKELQNYIQQRQQGGIYVLHMADNTLYVGQAKDVVKRYAQHYHNYHDIVNVSFKHIDKNNLDTEEVFFIKQLEKQGFRLLNILHASVTYSSSDFDLLVPADQQKRWLSNPSWVYPGEERQDEGKEEQRLKYHQKFEKFSCDPSFQATVALLKQYVQNCIPAFRSTQFEYWMISCLPSTLNNARYSTVSLSIMETFVAGKGGWSFINIAQSIFRETYLTNSDFLRKYPHTEIRYISYEGAGFDQICVVLDSIAQATQVLQDPAIILAARLLNLQLMRKRRVFYRQYHCFDLADLLVS
jgi:hypothetical protein